MLADKTAADALAAMARDKLSAENEVAKSAVAQADAAIAL